MAMIYCLESAYQASKLDNVVFPPSVCNLVTFSLNPLNYTNVSVAEPFELQPCMHGILCRGDVMTVNGCPSYSNDTAEGATCIGDAIARLTLASTGELLMPK